MSVEPEKKSKVSFIWLKGLTIGNFLKIFFRSARRARKFGPLTGEILALA